MKYAVDLLKPLMRLLSSKIEVEDRKQVERQVQARDGWEDQPSSVSLEAVLTTYILVNFPRKQAW